MISFIVNSCTFNLHIHYNVTNKINQDKSTFHYILISTVMHQLHFLKIIITIFLVILNIWPQYALSEIIFLQLVWQNCNLGGTLWSWGEREHLCSIVKKKGKKGPHFWQHHELPVPFQLAHTNHKLQNVVLLLESSVWGAAAIWKDKKKQKNINSLWVVRSADALDEQMGQCHSDLEPQQYPPIYNQRY